MDYPKKPVCLLPNADGIYEFEKLEEPEFQPSTAVIKNHILVRVRSGEPGARWRYLVHAGGVGFMRNAWEFFDRQKGTRVDYEFEQVDSVNAANVRAVLHAYNLVVHAGRTKSRRDKARARAALRRAKSWESSCRWSRAMLRMLRERVVSEQHLSLHIEVEALLPMRTREARRLEVESRRGTTLVAS